jgi:hypothetical protein
MNKEKYNLCKKMFSEGKSLTFIGKTLNVDRGRLSEKFKREGIVVTNCNNDKHKFNESIFENLDSEEKYYWFGFIYADGCIMENEDKLVCKFELSLCEKDLGHLEKFKKFLGSNIEIKYKEKVKAYKIGFTNRKFVKDLVNLGLTPRKSLTKVFPEIDKNYINWFLRGYFDGNGYVLSKFNRASFVSTKYFIDYVVEYLDFDKKFIKKDKRHHENIRTLNLHGNNSKRFLKFIYQDSTVHLDRKYDKAKIILPDLAEMLNCN